jgi:hypothetical protein
MKLKRVWGIRHIRYWWLKYRAYTWEDNWRIAGLHVSRRYWRYLEKVKRGEA